MAVSSSLADCLSLEIDSRFIEAGTDISGSVLLRLSSPASASGLYLCFSGKESFYYTEPAFRRQIKPWGYDFDLVKRKVVEERAEIVTFQQGVVQAGAYRFPFRIEVPELLPGSLHCELNLSHLSIRYKLTAILQGTSAKTTTSLHLYSPPKLSSAPSDLTVCVPLSACCFSKGYLQMKASFEKDSFTVGDLCEIQVEIDTQKSALAVQRVRVTLWEVYLLQGKTHHTSAKVISEEEVAITVPPGQASFGQNCVSVKLKVKSECQSTVRGKAVQCLHRVVVRVMAAGEWQITTIEKLVDVRSSLASTIDSFSVSPSWEPQIYPLTRVSIPSTEDFPAKIPLLP